MGDVVGGLQFTYISLDDYRIVRSAVLGDGSYTTVQRGAVPYSVFLEPPFSRVGMSEEEARSKGYSIMTAKLPYTVLRDMIFAHPTMSEALNDLFNV